MEQNQCNVSDWFRMPAALFFRCVAIQNRKYCILLTIALILVGLALGLVLDYRYAVVSLMIFLILFPLMLAIAYIYDGFLKTCYFNTTLHKISLSANEIHVIMKWKNVKENANGDGEEKEEEVIKNLTFRKDEFGKLVVLNDSVLIRAKADKGFLWIPVDAFENEECFTEFVNKIVKNSSF